MAIWPFRRNERADEAETLLQAVVSASRRPALFGEGKAPDTLEGRFELMTLHAALALIRLRAAGAEARPLAQTFTDMLFRHFDAGLREAAVGDLVVPKRMRKMASAFYGRLEAYAGPIADGDETALADALQRNILGDGPVTAWARTLAQRVLAASGAQAEAPISALGEPAAWPTLS